MAHETKHALALRLAERALAPLSDAQVRAFAELRLADTYSRMDDDEFYAELAAVAPELLTEEN